jgi:UDP-N-acetyl-D-mannosaminuronate dehydrogenase
LSVVERLLTLGADVKACEPYMPESGAPAVPVPVVKCTPEELAAADLVLLLVDHPDFPLDQVAKHGKLVLDTKGVLRHLTFTGEVL